MRENARVAADREKYNARKVKERSSKKAELAAEMRRRRAQETLEQRAARLEKAKMAQRAWRAENSGRGSIAVAKKAYKQRNPGKVRADTVRRRTAQLQRTPGWLAPDDFWMMEQAYELAALRTKMFGFVWHVDHVVPLQGKRVSGLHVPTNLQVIPGVENVSKANKWAHA